MRKVVNKDYKQLGQRIYNFYKQERKMPSYEDMKTLFEVSSKDTVSRIVDTLISKGIVLKDKTGKLIPTADELIGASKKGLQKVRESLGVSIMLGSVEAGFPSFVEVGEMDTVTLDEWLIGDKTSTFILKVKGESMQDKGILDGDYVIVERGKEPKLGDSVLANVDGAWTLKTYKKDKQGIYLEPANKRFRNIRPKESLEIPAVVISVIRKL